MNEENIGGAVARGLFPIVELRFMTNNANFD